MWENQGAHEYNTARSDWTATWQTWVRNQVGYRSDRAGREPRRSDSDRQNSRAPVERTTRGDEANCYTPDSAVQAHKERERLKRERAEARAPGGFT